MNHNIIPIIYYVIELLIVFFSNRLKKIVIGSITKRNL